MTARYPMLGDNMRMVNMREVVEAVAKLLHSWDENFRMPEDWGDVSEADRDLYRDRAIEALLPATSGWSGL